MKSGYELEIAYRKIAEYQERAAHDAMVKELKASSREQPVSAWPGLLWRRLFMPGQRPNQPQPGQLPASASLLEPAGPND